MAKRHVEGAIGVVRRDGELLIARRKAGDYYGGWWEFPGGKRHDGETYEETLHREMDEELGITVRVVRELCAIDHEYADRTVHLVFFLCDHRDGDPRPIESDEVRWVRPEDLPAYVFPAANAEVIRRLIEGAG